MFSSGTLVHCWRFDRKQVAAKSHFGGLYFAETTTEYSMHPGGKAAERNATPPNEPRKYGYPNEGSRMKLL